MKELIKKLSLKKAFFATQLESFFNSMVLEFQEKCNSLQTQNKLLEEKNKKLEYDVKNLEKIKKDLLALLEEEEKKNKLLTQELQKVKKSNLDEEKIFLSQENEKLKSKIADLNSEIKKIEEKFFKMQAVLKKGTNAYKENLLEKKTEELLKEITKNISK